LNQYFSPKCSKYFCNTIGQKRLWGHVGSMSGLPEGGLGEAIYEYTRFLDEFPSFGGSLGRFLLLQSITIVASVLAHLRLQDALAAMLGAEALPDAVDAKLFTAVRSGTGPERRLGRGLATGHGARSSSWSKPDDQRICPARHGKNPSRI
jgi:hypothetical protein